MSSGAIGAGETNELGFKDLKKGHSYRLLPNNQLDPSIHPNFITLSQSEHQLSYISYIENVWVVRFNLGNYIWETTSVLFPDGIHSKFIEIKSGGKRKSRNITRRKSGKSRKAKGKGRK